MACLWVAQRDFVTVLLLVEHLVALKDEYLVV